MNVSGIAPPIEGQPKPTPELCFISGTIYNFTYYSKTLAVKVCEAEVIRFARTNLYICVLPAVSCKEGGEVYYDTNLTRIWAGEERFRMPGLCYSYVPCNKSYLIQPVYQPYGEECPWQGNLSKQKGI